MINVALKQICAEWFKTRLSLCKATRCRGKLTRRKAWALPLRRTQSQEIQASPGRERIGSPRHKARVSQAGRFQGAQGILGLVSTVTHVHPIQPRPRVTETTSPRIPQACLSLYTGSGSQTLKETPKAPSRCFGRR